MQNYKKGKKIIKIKNCYMKFDIWSLIFLYEIWIKKKKIEEEVYLINILLSLKTRNYFYKKIIFYKKK